MNTTHRPAIAALLLLLGGASTLVACSSSAPAASATSTPTTRVTPMPPECPHQGGGECLGSLEAGTYQTVQFAPKITYKVPEGWFNAEDLPGNFWLYRETDEQSGAMGGSYIGIYQGASASARDCAERPEPGVGRGSADLVAYIAATEGLIATEPQTVEVGGLTGLTIDLIDDPQAGEPCTPSDAPELSFVPMIIGSGVSHLWHVIDVGVASRLIVLDWEGQNVTIEITTVDGQLPTAEYLELVQPIIDSLTFG